MGAEAFKAARDFLFAHQQLRVQQLQRRVALQQRLQRGRRRRRPRLINTSGAPAPVAIVDTVAVTVAVHVAVGGGGGLVSGVPRAIGTCEAAR